MSSLQNKRILVTGGNGFLGKHLVQHLWERGYDTHTADVKRYDLRYSGCVDEMYQRIEPQVVINLAAAVGGIGDNLKRPGTFCYDNMMMGMNVLEGARCYGVEKFVQMGSACEYPRDAEMPLVEWNLWSGYPEGSNAAYGIAKRALFTMGQAYREQYGMNVIHILPTNLYGPGDNFEGNGHFIPAAIRRVSEAVESGSETVEMWGTGEATRDFLYVKDAAEGIALAMERYNHSEPVNLGSGKEWKIREVAQKIGLFSGFAGKLTWDESKPDGQPRRVLDTSKAKAFGWEADTLLEAGLLRTIEWYNSVK